MNTPRPTTESLLKDWRNGQTQAERMCGAILHADGYEDVDPQCPLGGPDGTKDLICVKDSKRMIAAAYFSTTNKTFSEIKKKFGEDTEGIQKNDAQGIVFLCNQRLSPTERKTLADAASPSSCQLYHIERLITILDSPIGYGIRLQFLGIPMTLEEQQALWSSLDYEMTRQLLSNQETLSDLSRKVDLLLERTADASGSVFQQHSSMLTPGETVNEIEHPSSQLTVGMLCWLHALATEGMGVPMNTTGKLRSIQVFIGGPDEPKHTPPPPEEIPSLTREFAAWWRHHHPQLMASDSEQRIQGLAEFHHKFLSIHPFLDGNGRLARVLLDQAAIELIGKKISLEVVADLPTYFEALRSADEGDSKQLVALIQGAAL